MRTPKYMSPTSLRIFESNPEEYYINYLADNRPPRMPQTQPMSVGSAFDAYVKSYLHERLFGVDNDPAFALDTLFEAQVEEHNRDWAYSAGAYAFDCYCQSGALANLMIELSLASMPPRFEFTVESNISHSSFADDVPILGKPDLYFVTAAGSHVILDWKVNGFCAKRKISPKKGYVRLTPDGKIHKSAHPMVIDGISVNIAYPLEEVDAGWAAQCCTYGWVLGEDIGSKFIIGIDQLACGPNPKGLANEPTIRVASHRGRVSADFQVSLARRYATAWAAINSGHFFSHLSQNDSDARCLELDNFHKAFDTSEDASDNEKWFTESLRKH